MEFNYPAIFPVVLVLSALQTLKSKVLGGQTGFYVTPQNATLIAGKPLIFNCSTADFLSEGMDWSFSNASVQNYHIFECQRFDYCFLVNNLDNKTYKLEQPNNLTSNLIILHANLFHVGEYCCHYPNGMRDKMACAFATVEGAPNIAMSTTGKPTSGSITGNSNLYALFVILVAILAHFD